MNDSAKEFDYENNLVFPENLPIDRTSEAEYIRTNLLVVNLNMSKSRPLSKSPNTSNNSKDVRIIIKYTSKY